VSTLIIEIDQGVYDGWQLRDATLEDVIHYFVYHADAFAEAFLG